MSGGRKGGRGALPDPTVRQRVLDAFVERVAERGLANVSIDDVAQAAGVSKPTLYKRWPTRDSLVIDAFSMLSPASSNGSPELHMEGTLRETLERMFGHIASREKRQMLAELITAAGYDPAARDALWRREEHWRCIMTQLVEYGKSTGEVPEWRDTVVIVELLMNLTTMRGLIGNMPVGGELAALAWRLLTDERPY
jgi:AcrR family transcriptional regulator